MTTAVAKRQNGNPSVSFGSVVDNIFQNSLRRFFDDSFFEQGMSPMASGSIPVNVRETDQQYELDLVAPGCRKEDFNIDLNDNMLTISFEQKAEKKEENENAGWVRKEFTQRSFSRSFTLNDMVDINRISATYTDGILHLVLPKNENSKKLSRNIEVK